MNWTDTTRADRFVFEMVDPNNIEQSRGTLDGVTDCSITYGYYTDTRVSASITAVEPNYIENSLVRIHHYVDDENYHNELGTFFVDEIKPTRSKNANEYSFELVSLLGRISEDCLEFNYAVDTYKSTTDVLKDLFDRYDVDYMIMGALNGATYTGATIYEAGEGVLDTVFAVADKANNRIEVNGHGIVEVSNYVLPGSRTRVYEYNADAPDSLVYGEIVETSDFYSVPNRAIVTHKDGDNMYSGFADIPSTSVLSKSRRGRRVTSVYNVDDLEPKTNAGAGSKALELLNNNADVSLEIECNTLYVPIKPGDVVGLTYNGETHKAMLKTRELSLSPGMPCKDTFKAV